MSTYQNTDVVRDDDDDFEANTEDGMIASSLISSTKTMNRGKSALKMLAATAFCGVSSVGLVSWNNNNANNIANTEALARIGDGDVDLLFGNPNEVDKATKKPVDACDDAINYDEDECFILSHCDDTYYNNYVMCYGERKNSRVIDFDLYEHGQQRVCPKTDSLTQYLFGEDYVMNHCYDTHCYQNNNADDTDLQCVYNAPNGQKTIIGLECGTLYSEGTCRVCNLS